MSYHLVDCLQRIAQPRVLVVGDLILDRYIWGEAERVSQEAPVILLREERQEIRLGGAANVANMLRGLEAEVTMAGAVGDDADGRLVRRQLEEAGCGCECVVVDATRPTTVKERYLGRAQHRHPHQMLRVDREVRTPLAGAVVEEFLNAVLAQVPLHDAVLISDYAKGVCTHEVTQAVIQAARAAGIPVIADPASSGDYAKYARATAITPNRLETSRAAGMEIRTADEAFAAGRLLCERLSLDHIFVTLDSDGIALVRNDGTAEMLTTRKREVYDITGAGDMVLAMIGVGAAAGIEPVDLAKLANVAGGLEVEQIGVVAISREEILADLIHGTRGSAEKVCLLDEAARHVAGRRKLGQRIVFTNGCFDLLHAGHVAYLNEAAREGDCLIVGLNSDRSVRSLEKAPDRPLFDENHRATMLAALQAVDYVVLFDEVTPHALLERLKPELLVKGGTYAHDEIVGWELVESYGGQAKPLGMVPGLSTTEILARLRDVGNPATISHPSIQVRKAA
ncbi:MAG: bifunctional heptose 7-phosphate kinase/heptose 1-phosphate adenyltransferase [Planctomycetaceae bacterium]